jgi:hypothetical protein
MQVEEQCASLTRHLNTFHFVYLNFVHFFWIESNQKMMWVVGAIDCFVAKEIPSSWHHG